MATYYGEVQGNRGEAHRLGSQRSGLRTVAASWEGAVRTQLYEKDGHAHARVELMPWHGAGVHKLIYDGPVGGRRRSDGPEGGEEA